MSSYVIDNKCMTRIVEGLFWSYDFKNLYGSLYSEQNLNESEDYEALALRLWDMNERATNARYKEFNLTPQKFKWNNSQVNPYQILKSMHCLRYQCSEGNIPETDLYKWINKVISCFETFLISKIEDYKNAQWG
jgi:hypothetical protein